MYSVWTPIPTHLQADTLLKYLPCVMEIPLKVLLFSPYLVKIISGKDHVYSYIFNSFDSPKLLFFLFLVLTSVINITVTTQVDVSSIF